MDGFKGAVVTLIDGDIIAYSSAAHRPYLLDEDGEIYKLDTGKYAKRDATLQESLDKVDQTVEEILEETSFYCPTKMYKIYLTGKGNFRHDVATTAVYKGNRKDIEKPQWLGQVREYLIKEHAAVLSEGEEADDMIAIDATKYKGACVIASIDKDFLQIPGLHYNFNRKTFTYIGQDDGLKNFYLQILTGDAVDNIKGLHRVGPVKADKMLHGLHKEEDLWEAVVKAYDGDTDRVIENARLLWLRRKENELWEPPVKLEA